MLPKPHGEMCSVPTETLFLCSELYDQSPADLSVVSQLLFSSLPSYTLNTEDPQATALPAHFLSYFFEKKKVLVKFVSRDSK